MNRIFALAIFFAAGCSPASALYCGTQLILEGMTKPDVLQRCGEPTYSESRPIYDQDSIPYVPPNSSTSTTVIIVAPGGVVDEWVYNWGPGRFMPRLIFRNGLLVSVESLGYGH